MCDKHLGDSLVFTRTRAAYVPKGRKGKEIENLDLSTVQDTDQTSSSSSNVRNTENEKRGGEWNIYTH